MSLNQHLAGNGRGGWASRRGRGNRAGHAGNEGHENRGGRGGRGGRGRRGGWNATPKEVNKSDLEKYPLGDLLQTMEISDLKIDDDASTSTTITECQHVASYNWLNTSTPTIVVPGKPPRWTPPPTAYQLQKDAGVYFRDPNAARYPSCPTAPVVHAILATSPAFLTSSVDLFACGNTLGNLLRFVCGSAKAFRFNVELINNTVFFVRKEDDPKAVMTNVQGYGHTFPEAYTTLDKELQGSETHQRVISYQFAGLKCLIRFESDGYIDDNASSTPKTSSEIPSSSEADQDAILAAPQAASSTPQLATTSPDTNLTVKHAGTPTPHSAIFDLKTRSGKHGKVIDMADVTPLLWLKQIPKFILAYHDGAGLFRDPEIQDTEAVVKKWENKNEITIKRLAALLDKIVVMTKEEKGVLLEVYFSGDLGAGLEIRKQFGEGMHALPEDVRRMWVSAGQGHKDKDKGKDEGANGDENMDEAQGENDIMSDDNDNDGGYKFPDSDDEEPKDYTACSLMKCGYCGHCTY